ncbi:multidrug transporter [Azoarcus sp. DD4]|uniref:AdeC/AdeK/OprM family multidrug efflux complex outer membrane factor n=1 Tax=Azoarcus sp. DD4 TaxID=2027405 RepID=UPI00112611D9|nr:AdeC/AdeK/OprM family multidrug efflux complex outer membrane factor [Azoarcus sp. DD4]QDF95331.1 multidrug transporter [Azoarcus sp. DD4]
MPLKTLVIAVAAVLAGACSTLAPDYQRPAAPVAAGWPGEVAQPAAGTPAADEIAWRSFFADQRLRDLIDLALANNRDLRVSALNIEKARAQYQIQRADLFPSIGLSGGQSAQRLPGDLTTTGEPRISRQYSTTVGFSSYELDFFGRVRSLRDQALEQYLATEDARRSAQISLVAEVANAWLTLAADRERLDLARRTYEAQQQSYELTKKSFDFGAVSAIDLRQAQTARDSARADLASYTAQVARDLNALNLVAGTTVPAELQPAQLTDTVSAVGELPAGVPSEVLVRRPDILAAERQLRGANASIGAARAAFFPSITLTAAAGTASATLEGLFKSGSGTWSFAPQINLPIFEAGRLSANLEVAKVQREIAVADYEKSIQSAFREVADALAERATLGDELDARRALVEATAETYKLSEARYRSGVDSYLGLLDAQRTLYSAEQALITVRLSDVANRVALYKVLGGGWQ